MHGMFLNSGYNATNFDIGNLDDWDTSSVADMGHMFQNAGYNATTFNIGNLSTWNTSNVINMYHMFLGVGNNATDFSQDLSGWNVSKVIGFTEFKTNNDSRIIEPAWVNEDQGDVSVSS